MSRRNSNGEGSVYQRQDGRWEAALYVTTPSAARRRLRIYGASRQEAHDKLLAAKVREQQGIPTPDRTWKLGDYLDYWLREVVKPNRRPTTYARYELAVRRYLKPGLGGQTLTGLSVPQVQTFLNQRLATGSSVRNVQIMREVLRAALSRAIREEILVRNVAALVELPKWERGDIQPWSTEEAKHFLQAARPDPLYAAFLLLTLYGLRRGEVLGLRWSDVDFEHSVLRIRQQVQRIDGALQAGPVKTRAGRRDLPLVPLVHGALVVRPRSEGPAGYVFATKSGQPIEPRNFVRSFHRIREQHGLRRIRVHDVRHTAATMLKNSGVPARDAQLILGHSTVLITQEIYQHDDMDSRAEALQRVEKIFMRVADGSRCRQLLPSRAMVVALATTATPGRGDRDRTCDTRFWSWTKTPLADRATSVKREMQARTRQWLVGLVAVNLAVKILGPDAMSGTHSCPRCGYEGAFS